MKPKVGMLFLGWLISLFSFLPYSVGQEWDPRTDLNGDGIVDGKDLLIFMKTWRLRAPTPTPTPAIQRKMITIPIPGLPEAVKPLEMVLIPAGTFLIGSPTNERGRTVVEWPSFLVTLTRDFYMGKYEVTQGQWIAIMGKNPALSYGIGDNYPIYKVSWDDCVEFIRKLNTLNLGYFYLPTEAQWEYACRAGTFTRFSFGDAWECPDLGADFCQSADRYVWWIGNDTSQGSPTGPKEVGLKMPNPWGLFDMHGNVKEWCNDWWELPYERSPQVNPVGTTAGSARVIRGGGWSYELGSCRSAVRSGGGPTGASNVVGFRLVRMYP